MFLGIFREKKRTMAPDAPETLNELPTMPKVKFMICGDGFVPKYNSQRSNFLRPLFPVSEWRQNVGVHVSPCKSQEKNGRNFDESGPKSLQKIVEILGETMHCNGGKNRSNMDSGRANLRDD